MATPLRFLTESQQRGGARERSGGEPGNVARSGSGSCISIESVDKSFPQTGANAKQVLDDVSLEIEDGEFVSLVGVSGCGKTTILNMLAGLVQPTEGRVVVFEQSPKAARRAIGYMFARDCLLPWRTARGNVEFSLELHGSVKTKAERRSKALVGLERVHLGDAGDLYPWQLSQGMRQRVALARTWATGPSLLLMDEPFAALDAQTRRVIQAEFMELWESEQRTVVFVTHDVGEALALSDRVVVLSAGRIAADIRVPFERPRDIDTLTADPSFSAIYREVVESL